MEVEEEALGKRITKQLKEGYFKKTVRLVAIPAYHPQYYFQLCDTSSNFYAQNF